MKRAVALLVMLSIASAMVLACSKRQSRNPNWQKMIVLGFDGMDPDLVQRWVDDGKLPNIKRLIDQGGLYALRH